MEVIRPFEDAAAAPIKYENASHILFRQPGGYITRRWKHLSWTLMMNGGRIELDKLVNNKPAGQRSFAPDDWHEAVDLLNTCTATAKLHYPKEGLNTK